MKGSHIWDDFGFRVQCRRRLIYLVEMRFSDVLATIREHEYILVRLVACIRTSWASERLCAREWQGSE